MIVHGGNSPGYVAISGMREVFKDFGLESFKGIESGSDDCSTPDSTLFLENLLQEVFSHLEKIPSSTKSLIFNGFREIRSDDKKTLRYGSFGTRKKYYVSSRIGIERAIEGMIAMARLDGIELSREYFFEETIVDQGYESTKVPHLDPFPGFGSLQKFVSNVSGGDTQLFDVGQMCNDKNLKPWEVLMLHSPNPQHVFGESKKVPFIPYKAFIVKPKYVEELHHSYCCEILTDPEQVLIFNNMIARGDEGEFYCIAHGATTPEPVNESPIRDLTLSIAFPALSLAEMKRLYKLIYI